MKGRVKFLWHLSNGTSILWKKFPALKVCAAKIKLTCPSDCPLGNIVTLCNGMASLV